MALEGLMNDYHFWKLACDGGLYRKNVHVEHFIVQRRVVNVANCPLWTGLKILNH